MITTEINERGKKPTMTVSEMKKKLEEYPDDFQVVFQWDDCYWTVGNSCFEEIAPGKLVIWAEGCSE